MLRSIKLSLRTRELDCFDYASSTNPPVLHRKETFLPADHPLHARFARPTQQEEKHGLLDDTATIGTTEGWKRRLEERGFALRGHRLVRRRNHEVDAGGGEWEPRKKRKTRKLKKRGFAQREHRLVSEQAVKPYEPRVTDP